MRILVAMPDTDARADFFPDRLRERLESLGTVEWNDREQDYSETELADRIDGVDVLITGWGSPQVTEDVVSEADDLDLIAHTGGSVANVASAASYEAGVDVVSANDVMADHTAEHALAAILAEFRAIPSLTSSMASDEWADAETKIRTLHGTSIGLVGLGTVGGKLLDHFAPFDVDVDVYDPYVDEAALADYPFASLADLDAALDSDVVSVHAARTPETVDMLGADELATMPDDALFVNSARAEIVVEDALLAELRSGRLGAVLDVYHEEPLPGDHELRGLENAILTPHVGGSQIRAPLTESVIADVERYADGDPLERAIPRSQWETMTR